MRIIQLGLLFFLVCVTLQVSAMDDAPITDEQAPIVQPVEQAQLFPIFPSITDGVHCVRRSVLGWISAVRNWSGDNAIVSATPERFDILRRIAATGSLTRELIENRILSYIHPVAISRPSGLNAISRIEF